MEYEFIKSEEQSEKIKGMTVFNTAQVDTKNNQCSSGNP